MRAAGCHIKPRGVPLQMAIFLPKAHHLIANVLCALFKLRHMKGELSDLLAEPRIRLDQRLIVLAENSVVPIELAIGISQSTILMPQVTNGFLHACHEGDLTHIKCAHYHRY